MSDLEDEMPEAAAGEEDEFAGLPEVSYYKVTIQELVLDTSCAEHVGYCIHTRHVQQHPLGSPVQQPHGMLACPAATLRAQLLLAFATVMGSWFGLCLDTANHVHRSPQHGSVNN